MLYMLSNGNPLEAKDSLLDYVRQKKNDPQDLKKFLPSNFSKRVSTLMEKHLTKFLANKNEVFKNEFDSILPFLDANIDVRTIDPRMKDTIQSHEQTVHVCKSRNRVFGMFTSCCK